MRPKLWRASGREFTAHRPEVLDFGGLYTHITRRDCTPGIDAEAKPS